MKDLVLCCVVCCCLVVSYSSFWCVFLFDGIMRNLLAIVEATLRRLPLCRRDCGLRGSIAGTIVGALYVGGFVGSRRTEVCSSGSHFAGVPISLRAFERSGSSRECSHRGAYNVSLFWYGFSVGCVLQPLGAPGVLAAASR